MQIDENEVVINAEPTFFEELAKVLKATSKRTLANYLLWTTLSISETLTKEFRSHRSPGMNFNQYFRLFKDEIRNLIANRTS